MQSSNESFDDDSDREPTDAQQAHDEGSHEPSVAEDLDAEHSGQATSESETNDATSDSAPLHDRAFRTGIITFVSMILIFAALNWPYQYTTLKTSSVGQLSTPVDFDSLQQEPPTMAGVPFRYLVSFPSEVKEESVRVFSSLALLFDVLVALVPITLVTYYFYRRSRRLFSNHSESKERRLKRITIADLLAVTMLLAIPLGIWQRTSAAQKAELDFAYRIKKADGAVELQAWVPKLFATRVPNSISNLLKRIRIVRIENPSNSLLMEVIAINGLTGLRIGGSDYDLRTLDRLHGNSIIGDLRVAGRTLDTRAMQSLSSCPRLHTLNLMRTNTNVAALSLLSEAKSLQRLCLIHTDVKLKDLGSPVWSKSIRELWLPHPDAGGTDALEISDWPNLERLVINELDTTPNASEMKVSLTDLPELKSLELDALQKFDMTLRDLPRLETISETAFEWHSRIPRGGSAPGKLWFSRLDIENLPELSGDIDFYGVDLKSFRTRGTPKVRGLGVGAYHRTVSNAPYARELSAEASTALINGIGESDGPPLADLDAVPLAGVDLAPLAKNKGLNQLMMSQTKTNLSQWKSLAKMGWLKRLDVKDCEIDSDGVAWILETFPNLEHFAFSHSNQMFFAGGRGVSVEIVDKPNLRTLDFGDSTGMFFNKVRIVNSPNVKLDLDLQFVEALELINAASITGLAVHGPLPRKFKLEGLRDLDYLAIGGPQVDDKVIEAIRQCKRLRKLTLAYPSASAESLKSLPLEVVEDLHLLGANVNDSVVQAWEGMALLKTLDLSDTKITGRSIPKLLFSESLEELRLNHTGVTAADLAELDKHISLRRLELAGVGINTKTLAAILQNGLGRLNLSDTVLDPKFYRAVQAHGITIRHIVLQDCQVNSAEIYQIAKAKRVSFDLTGSDATTQLQSALLSDERICSADEYDQRLMMQSAMSSMSNNVSVSRPASIIQTSYFSPRNQANAVGGFGTPVQTMVGSGGNVQVVPQKTSTIGGWFNQIFSSQSGPNEQTDGETEAETADPDLSDSSDSAVESKEQDK